MKKERQMQNLQVTGEVAWSRGAPLSSGEPEDTRPITTIAHPLPIGLPLGFSLIFLSLPFLFPV